MLSKSHWTGIFTFTTTSFAPFFSGRFLWITPCAGLRPTTTSGVADFLSWTGSVGIVGDFLRVVGDWCWGSGDLRIGFGFGTLKIIGCTGATVWRGALPKGLSSERYRYENEFIGIILYSRRLKLLILFRWVLTCSLVGLIPFFSSSAIFDFI